jgi:TRAP-type transport system small permease protein
MLKALDAVHVVLRWLVAATFTVLLIAVLIQIVSRLLLPNPPIWTEELSRFCLIFAAAFGAGLALRSGELVGVDIFTMNLSRRGRLGVELLTLLAMIAFCVILIPPSWDYVDIGSLQTSPAMQWNMFYIHMAVLIAPITLGLAALERLLRIVLNEWKAA